ncbi:hypothetical protein D3C77_595650 [compost metagenome]
MPVKFAAPISPEAIRESVHYLETYEPLIDPLSEDEMEELYEEEEVYMDQLGELMGESQWLLTKSMIQTDAIETYMEQIEEAPIEEVIIEATSEQWADAINSLTAIAALVGNKKMSIDRAVEGQTDNQRLYEKKWQWLTPDEQHQVLRNRNLQKNDTPSDPADSGV